MATVITIVNYDRTVITIINYDPKTSIVQATGEADVFITKKHQVFKLIKGSMQYLSVVANSFDLITK